MSPRPLTIAEANFVAEVAGWPTTFRRRVLREAGVSCGSHQGAAELASMLLALYRKAYPVDGPGTPQDAPRPDDDPMFAREAGNATGAKPGASWHDWRFRIPPMPLNADDLDAMVYSVLC